jgi:hypothetical protein
VGGNHESGSIALGVPDHGDGATGRRKLHRGTRGRMIGRDGYADGTGEQLGGDDVDVHVADSHRRGRRRGDAGLGVDVVDDGDAARTGGDDPLFADEEALLEQAHERGADGQCDGVGVQ